MAHLPKNLPALLRQAGLTVVVVDGYRTRGRPGAFAPVGVLNHHTGVSAKGWTKQKELDYARWMFTTGRADLPAPLCHIALGRSGTVYVGAAGRANHAGQAKAAGSVAAGDGNRLYIGVEWMLSGTEPIPAVMMQVGVRLNAVLTKDVTKTSVQTVVCHYQTSVTGKWDIGDPNGVAYGGKRVLDMGKFRTAVEAERKRLTAPVVKPPKDHVDVKVAHFSGLYRNNVDQWRHDIDTVLSRGFIWITGTEVGENRAWRVVKAVAKTHGYRVIRYKSNWVGVKKSFFKKGTFKKGTLTVVKKELVHGPGHDSALLWATFGPKDTRLKTISVIAGHYPTKGQPDARDPKRRVNLPWTKAMAKAIGAKARELGKGDALAFYGGDQNIVDKHNDTFFGEPLLSCWDEMKKWPGTGHGNIDVIAKFKGDKRVTCVGARRWTDKQLFLHSDHFLIQATYRIAVKN